MKTQTLTVSWPWYGAGADDPAYKVEKIGNSTQFKPGRHMKLWQCTCGMTFDSKHRLTNHIGYAILLDDNANEHKDMREAFEEERQEGQKLNEKQVDLLCKTAKWNVTIVKSS